MKTRIGFVSNSSSSSYVLFADKEFFDETLNKYDDIRPIIAEYKKGKYLKQVKFLGKDIMVLVDWTDAGGGGPEIDLDEEDDDKVEKMWNRFFKFKGVLEKNKEKCHYEDTDM